MDAFSQWLGKPVDFATAFTGAPTAHEGWQIALPRGGDSLASAQGDTTFIGEISPTTVCTVRSALGVPALWPGDGRRLVCVGRPGGQREGGESYAAAFRRIVTVMRQAQPTNKCKFIWNPTEHMWPNRTYFESIWPGDAYVDVLGINVYDLSLVQHQWVSTYFGTAPPWRD